MQRDFYLELASSGLAMPIGADLTLRQRPNPEECLRDGRLLGEVVAETARHFKTPLAIPYSTVLFGNLPSKKFYSDDEISDQEVHETTLELRARMREVHHPHITGSECDVLSVDGCEESILRKVAVMCDAPE